MHEWAHWPLDLPICFFFTIIRDALPKSKIYKPFFLEVDPGLISGKCIFLLGTESATTTLCSIRLIVISLLTEFCRSLSRGASC